MGDILIKILVCFIAGAGAGIGTGFAGMSAAAIIGPMLATFLGLPAYEAIGIGLISDVLASAVSAYTYKKSGNLDIKHSLPMMISVLVVTVIGSFAASLLPDQTMSGAAQFAMIIIGLLCGLIILQPHLSGTIIVGVVGVAIMFLAGTRGKWLLMFLGVIFVAGVLFLLFFGYSMDRVEIWLHIEEVDPLGGAWQTLQGLYAIGSGGFFGTGIGSSRQKYGYVPEPQNDFIFPIICEELGFIGAFLLIALFVLLIWRGIKIGQNAPDNFTALTVWGLTFKIALQAAMNIAVVTNSMPNTGVSLPFISAGGTALMIQIFEVGIILSISRFSRQNK